MSITQPSKSGGDEMTYKRSLTAIPQPRKRGSVLPWHLNQFDAPAWQYYSLKVNAARRLRVFGERWTVSRVDGGVRVVRRVPE